jgi:DNA-binding HxlR family transcriptional regulator
MKRYGQHCPVARAAEVLAERWTLLIIRELLAGEDRFSTIARGLPRMSPSLLAARLRELQRCHIVRRRGDGPEARYELTEAGAELEPLLEMLGGWGARWMQELRADELDPALLMLDIQRQARRARLPERKVTVELHFSDVPADLRRWWLVLARADGIDICDTDPGRPVDVWLETGLATLTRIWLGDLSWPAALRAHRVRLTGERADCRALPAWLATSRYADAPRAPTPLRR